MSWNRELELCGLLVLITLLLAPECSGSTKYKIIVKTGKGYRPSKFWDRAGTDASIWIKLVGISRKTGRVRYTSALRLSGSFFRNHFEAGQTDVFKAKSSEDLTNIYKIYVKRNNFGVAPDWLLEKVTITAEDGQSYNFDANTWLTRPYKYYTFERSRPPPAPVPPTPVQIVPTTPQVQPASTKYKIIVKTGSLSRPNTLDGPGTDANIWIKLFGTSKTTGLADNTDNLKLSGSFFRNYFESGQTDEFDVKSPKDLTDINKIHVKRSNYGLGPDWLLEKVTVQIPTGQSYEFNANTWLTEKDKYYEFSSTVSPASTTLAPAPATLPASSPTPTPTSPPTLPPTPPPTIPPTPPPTLPPTPPPTLPPTPPPTLPPTPPPTPPPTLPPTPPPIVTPLTTTSQTPTVPQQPVITYDIVVYTGSSSESSSSANVYITLHGAAGSSSEIHLKSPSGQKTFTPASSKVFQINIPDVQRLDKITLRQDGSGSSPNWKIDKVLVIAQNEIVYEFVISAWLEPAGSLEQTLSDDYPATSIKFNSYPQCVHSQGSKVHPVPKTPLVLANGCSQLYTFFRLLPDGVILHLASGMCVQGESTADPKLIASGSKLVLNTQCTQYYPGAGTPYALQFQFTPGGSLREKQSGKCVYSNGGVVNTPLTFSDVCDTEQSKIGFINKDGEVLFPEKTGSAPTQALPTTPVPLGPPTTPAAPTAPGPPTPAPLTPGPPTPAPLPPSPPTVTPLPPAPPTLSPATSVQPTPTSPDTFVQTTPTPTPETESELEVIDPNHPEYGGNNSHVSGGPLPAGFCPGGCSPVCQPACTQSCCGVMQQQQQPQQLYPAVYAQPQLTICPAACTPANCRSTCHISCCTPKTDIDVWRQVMTKNNRIGHQNERDWD